MIKDFFLVGAGGAIGSMLRYGLSLLASMLMITSPIATMTANVLGAFAIGAIMAACDKGSFFLFAAIGICGGFTTFSTFSAQSIHLLQYGKYTMGILYIAVTLLLCLLSTWGGLYLGNKLSL